MPELRKIIEIPSLILFYRKALTLSGCAASPVVETTAVEPNTAKYFKKTHAIFEMTSTGSRIEGIDDESFRGEVSALIAAENELSIPLINVSGSIIETCQDTQ